MTASYLSDAFGDILGAVIRMVEGQPEATASFAEEPGEYRWRFIRKEPDRLIIRILDFPQLWGNRPDEEGKVLFEAECRLRTFAGARLIVMRLLGYPKPELINALLIRSRLSRTATSGIPTMTESRALPDENMSTSTSIR